MEELLREHDELLKTIPDGVAHDTANCTICTLREQEGANNTDPNGGEMSKTYTEEEFNAAIAEAIAPLQSELEAARASKTEQEIAEKIAEAVAKVEADKAELQTALDAAMVEAEAAKTANADLVAYLEAETKAAEEAAAFEATKDARLEQVKEAASFSDEYLAANAERWARMSEEDFESVISDWKEVASAASKPAGSNDEKKIPATTAMQASRSGEGNDKFAGVRTLMRASVAGNDPRTL